MTEEMKEKLREGRRLARERKALEARSGDLIEDGPQPPEHEPEYKHDPRMTPVEESDEMRDRLLANIDPAVAALFTADEIAAIVKKATDDAMSEKKKQALKTLTERARTHARVEQGLVSQDVIRTAAEQARMDELVAWRCRLPEGGGEGLRMDGRIIRHGDQVVTTRAVFASALSMMYESWITEFRFKGLKPVDQMRDFQSPEIIGGAVH